MIKEIKCQLWLNTYKGCFACKALFLHDFMCYYILKALTSGDSQRVPQRCGRTGLPPEVLPVPLSWHCFAKTIKT